MKKLVILALVVMLLPAASNAQIKQGDPGFYFDFPGGTIPVIRGETWCEYLYAANFYWASTLCPDGAVDTFAVLTGDIQGWPITNVLDDDSDAEGTCVILDDIVEGTWYFGAYVCITVPCEATVGDLNTLTAQMVYCDENMVAQPDSGDCEDPNYRSSGTVACYSTITQDFEVVASPPALYILQDTLYYVEQGQTAAYVPFSVCNGDACAPPTDYNYLITSLGTVGAALNQTGTASGVSGGTCTDVYGIVDAGSAAVCTYDTLTIIVWNQAGTVYDTCVQAVHVVEPIPVPLFTAPVVTILVLAMILAAAVIMKRHAVSKA
ncbi:MAG TPA: hypothetical protein ENO08_01810 [Candidatus Eisenbacteria bacterium]|uniref:Uncharacterized protein n=1 Tax=Eiseniibacteriota bacterium TaxID=2212470 RepID=A0A7V2ATY1_UNCEI|nr:hypothetical protein [Candidatus Eisenbacteria bacterium]